MGDRSCNDIIQATHIMIDKQMNCLGISGEHIIIATLGPQALMSCYLHERVCVYSTGCSSMSYTHTVVYSFLTFFFIEFCLYAVM